ncbi:probable transcriptional regulator SLK2 isoform X2 [Rhododendron vialii]|nr:probable transcriptional regulator SLK2 isoform X2 [Rhododendron vialii]
MDSYLTLPSSPLSFSSTNFSTLVIDASSKEQPTCSHRDQNSQVGDKRLCPQLQIGGTATSQPTSQAQQGSHHTGKRKEPGIAQMSKKPRLDRNQENILHQKIIQQLLQKQDTMAIQDHNQLLQALMQQHKLRNQQQQYIRNSVPQFVGIPIQQQQQQPMRHHLQQQVNLQIPAVQPHDAGICSRRLMQYVYHLRHRPPDNSLAYWRKFVANYYAPGAKERWCLSLYDNIGGHALGVFSRSATAWHCGICGSKSGKGFEAVFEILPRLIKIKFESGVIDELLFLDFPHEVRFPSGLMMLRYGKAVQESVYEQFRVVREGQLRIIFSPDLKILSWEFCAQHHEELVPRSLVAPQVNQLIEAAKKCQGTTEAVRSNAVSAQYLQSSCNVFVKEGRRLTGNLELLLVNDLGFPKRYVRFFQIAEVVNNMKELMTFSRDNKIGPIESLKTYPRKETTGQAKKMHETERLASAAVSPGSSNTMNEKSDVKKDGITTGSEKAGLAVKHERSCTINSSTQTGISLPLPFLGPQSSSPRVIQSPPVSDLSTSQLPHDGDDEHHRTIQNILQQMVYNSRAKWVQSGNTKVKEEVLEELDGNQVGKLSTRAWAPANVLGSTLGRSDYFDTGSNSNFSRIYSENTIVKREADILGRFQLPEAVQDMDYEFFKNGVLNDDWKWKA